eukprot:TRINITY_DN7365_c0_g1_i2.p1 TRINITY_DN7365_c0_g1~~TRINITY_DN7365_c0_g1_i2.p1  ORF type:complete len:387 (+),score=52.65 TRINITY_DN7365_c0_g1_i2:232-1392(+)
MSDEAMADTEQQESPHGRLASLVVADSSLDGHVGVRVNARQSGVKGVAWRPGKWVATYYKDGKQVHKHFLVKSFVCGGRSEEQAVALALEAAISFRKSKVPSGEAKAKLSVSAKQSGVKGVNWEARHKRWRGSYFEDGKLYSVYFSVSQYQLQGLSEDQAVDVAMQAAIAFRKAANVQKRLRNARRKGPDGVAAYHAQQACFSADVSALGWSAFSSKGVSREVEDMSGDAKAKTDTDQQVSAHGSLAPSVVAYSCADGNVGVGMDARKAPQSSRVALLHALLLPSDLTTCRHGDSAERVSGVEGVRWRPKRKRWQPYIHVNGRTIYSRCVELADDSPAEIERGRLMAVARRFVLEKKYSGVPLRHRMQIWWAPNKHKSPSLSPSSV